MRNTTYKIGYEYSIEGTYKEINEINKSLIHQNHVGRNIHQIKNNCYKIKSSAITPFEIIINLASKPCRLNIKTSLKSITPKSVRSTHTILNKVLGEEAFGNFLKHAKFYSASAELDTNAIPPDYGIFLKRDRKIYGNTNGKFKERTIGNMVQRGESDKYFHNQAIDENRHHMSITCKLKNQTNHVHWREINIHTENVSIICARIINTALVSHSRRIAYDNGLPFQRNILLDEHGISTDHKIDINLLMPIPHTWKEFIRYSTAYFKNKGDNLMKIKVSNSHF